MIGILARSDCVGWDIWRKVGGWLEKGELNGDGDPAMRRNPDSPRFLLLPQGLNQIDISSDFGPKQ